MSGVRNPLHPGAAALLLLFACAGRPTPSTANASRAQELTGTPPASDNASREEERATAGSLPPASVDVPPEQECAAAERHYRSEQETGLEYHRGEQGEEFSVLVERFVDVDRDGRLDCFVSDIGWCGTGGCRWRAYLAGATARFVGEFDGREPRLTASGAFAPIRINGHSGCCLWFETEHLSEGESYTPTRERMCRSDADGTACEPWTAPGFADRPEALGEQEAVD